MNLAGQRPHDTYKSLVLIDGNRLTDGTGSIITNLNITFVSASYVTESFQISAQITASEGIKSPLFLGDLVGTASWAAWSTNAQELHMNGASSNYVWRSDGAFQAILYDEDTTVTPIFVFNDQTNIYSLKLGELPANAGLYLDNNRVMTASINVPITASHAKSASYVGINGSNFWNPDGLNASYGNFNSQLTVGFSGLIVDDNGNAFFNGVVCTDTYYLGTGSAVGFVGTSSWTNMAVTAAFAMNGGGGGTGSADTSSFLSSSGVALAAGYTVGPGYLNNYTTDFTMSNSDNGKLGTVSGSGAFLKIWVTGSVSSTFTAQFYQSGSTQLWFITSSNNEVIRNRFSSTSSNGQYAVVSIFRVQNGDFVITGDV